MEYLRILILSMIPVTELRGAIPIGMALDLNPIGVYIASVAGSTLVSVPLVLTYRHIVQFMRDKKIFVKLLNKIDQKIENSMKVTKKDILSIKAGSSKVMQLDSYKDCVNARSYAYQLAFTDPREDVERYSTSIDKDKNQITIEAIKK